LEASLGETDMRLLPVTVPTTEDPIKPAAFDDNPDQSEAERTGLLYVIPS